MWIRGNRRGGGKNLSDHLQKTDENESIAVHELEGFAFGGLTVADMAKAIKQMEAIGFGKGDKRNLFHVILAPAYGCTLSAKERDFMLAYYIEHMGLKGHQYAFVEHWKKGKQHFHLIFNLVHSVSGKTHELKWSKQKEWRISRGLEQIFGHPTVVPKGKAARVWEMQRGNRTGIDPIKMRKEVTRIFHASKTAQEFASALEKAGYALSYGKRNQLVLVDRVGDTHGLMRRIEGKTLDDLTKKFSGIDTMKFAAHADLVKARKPQKAADEPRVPIERSRVVDDVQKAYRTSTTGAEFFAKLNKREYALGRGLKGFAVIDINGERYDLDELLGKETAKKLGEKFPDLAAICPRPVSEIIRRLKAKRPRNIVGKIARNLPRNLPRSIARNSGRNGTASNMRGSADAPVARTKAHSGVSTGGATAGATKNKPSDLNLGMAALRITAKTNKKSSPFRAAPTSKGWPPQAVADWAAWGSRAPARFFAKWPELAPEGFSPGGPSM